VIDDLMDEDDETVEFVLTGAISATVDSPTNILRPFKTMIYHRLFSLPGKPSASEES
jgi:hypothetical protein